MTSGNPPLEGSKSDLLRAAGDLAEQIRQHVETCKACPWPEEFSNPVMPSRCCRVGARLWREYRQARRSALGVAR